MSNEATEMMEVALDRLLVFEQVEPARMEILHQIHLKYPPIKCHELERMSFQSHGSDSRCGLEE